MKNIKITTPNDMSSEASKIEEIIFKFEEQFKNFEKDQCTYPLIIKGEYNRNICNIIETVYTEAGWRNVHCITTLENGGRPGSTLLLLNR